MKLTTLATPALLAILGSGLLRLAPISAQAATQTVTIQGDAYNPSSLNINVNDTVMWVQRDSVEHTTTSTASPPVWASPLLSLNQTYSFTFTASGNYPYTCTVHSFMHGSVTVAQIANQPPVVQLTAPTSGAVVSLGASVTLTATASDPDGTVSQVQFFDGTTSLGVVMMAPFTLTTSSLAAGTHQLTAQATDNQGATKVSAAVSLVVDAPPTVSLTSPADGATFKAPASVTITASAADADGTISQVEFLDGASSLGIVTAAPYTLTVTNLSSGSHQLTAKATDNAGGSTISAPVTILLANAPTVSLTAPGNGAVFLLPATISIQATAAASGGTITKVDFYSGTNLLGSAPQAPYSLTWSNVPGGAYALTAQATDSNGQKTTSSAVLFNVTSLAAYTVHNLVSDLAGWADNTDTNLLNPWGIATSPAGPFWLSDNHSGLSTIYNTTGAVQTLVVTVPPPAGGTPPAAPTGIVFNGSTNFAVAANAPAHFIFATEDGTISGWNTGSNAVLMADNSASGTVYKGLALASNGGSNYLYAADFHHGKVDVFDANYHAVSLPGGFADPNIPSGYAPFGIQSIGTNLYVTYAMQDSVQHDDVGGPGHGFVDVFDTAGNLLKRFVSAGPLNSPWGVALAPAGFGPFSGALLIGNFADGRINAFDPTSGAFLGPLLDAQQNPIQIVGLWGIKFGNGAKGGDGGRLYFAAGIAAGGSLEDHGLFGSISAVPILEITGIQDNGAAVTIDWAGGTGPYLLQKKASLTDSNWFDVLTTHSLYVTVPKDAPSGFYRVVDQAAIVAIPLSVMLSGSAEVPSTTSTATGVGSLTLEGLQLSYHITFSGLSAPATAAHIHGAADATHAAGVILPLNGATGTAGNLSGTVTLTSSNLAAIVSGMAYVNIHTTNNPGGEIRGQIVPLRIPVTLSGANEVPTVTTSATGSGWITLVGNQMFYDIDFMGLSTNAAAAHIHGPADATHEAAVLFPLNGASGTAGTLEGQQALTADQLDQLLAGLTYVNIHTALHPGGEIRGQVLPWQFTVNLSGSAEVPPVATTGAAAGNLSLSGLVLNYAIIYSALTGSAMAAHIHGPADQTHTAGVLFPLAGASGTAGTAGTLTGSETLTPDELADLLLGMAYANIHTPANASGEIRGQVELVY